MSDKQPPADVIRDGNIKATIWKRESDEGGGFFNTTFSRTYKDEEGNYRDTGSFGANDLLRLSELARSAYGRVRELRREDDPPRDQGDRAQRRERFAGERRPRQRDRNPNRDR